MSSEYQSLLYAVDDGICTITINRPQRRNALSDEVVSELLEALQVAQDDTEVRVVVLTGAGDRAFCAGGDLSPAAAKGGMLDRHWRKGHFVTLLKAFRDLGKPSIARVNGHALGGGLGLVMACDLAVGVESATLGTPEAKIGLFPMMIMALIVRHIGRKKALELMLTGQRISAQEACDLGFLNSAVPASELDDKVGELAQRLSSLSPAVLRLGLDSFHTMSDMHLDDALRFLQSQLTVNTLAEDAAEGIMAFISKRPPEWKGR